MAILAITASQVLHLQLQTPASPAWAELQPKDATPRLCGTITDIRGLTDQRLRISLAEVVPENRNDDPLPGMVEWIWEKPSAYPLPGQQICVQLRPKPVHGFANMGMADFEYWWKSRGVYWRLWSRGNRGNPELLGDSSTPSTLRQFLQNSLFHSLKSNQDGQGITQAQAILPALLFGDKFHLNHETVELFAQGTLAHSLALSGQHLAIAGIIGMLCIVGFAQAKPTIYLFRPRVSLILLASLPPACVYLWLGNAPASLVRAFCMLFLFVTFQQLGRARTILDILVLALACILLVWPAGILDTGLQLSAMCVFTIGLVLPLWRKIRIHGVYGASMPGRCANMLIGIFCISLSIQLALLPLNLLIFGNVGFWFPLNLMWLPLVDIVVLPLGMLGLCLDALGISDLAQPVLALAIAPCTMILDVLSFLDKHALLQHHAFLRPHWTSLPAYACLMAAISLHFGGAKHIPTVTTKRRLALAGLLFCLVGPVLHLMTLHADSIQMDVLDVGQGQALAIQTPGPTRILVDAGGSNSPRFDTGKSIVLPSLSYNRTPRFDALIASHPDIDHIGGLFFIAEQTHPQMILDNGRKGAPTIEARWEETLAKHPHRSLGAGDCIVLGKPELGMRLEVLHPPHANESSTMQWTGNDASLVLRLTLNGQGLALLPGDAGIAVLQHLMQEERDFSAQVLVASHHGSDKNFLPEFYARVNPKLVLASCGFRNRFGFPGARLTGWLKEHNIPFWQTDLAGALSVTWDAGGHMSVNSARLGLLK